MQDAKQRREDVGVELYGFQQHLAKLQTSLEQASDEHGAAAAARARADSTLAALRSQVAEEEAAADASKAQVEAVQKELDRLAAALRAVQAHNDAVASEVAVAKRATYATEGAVQALEVHTRQQDQLIDSMQQQLRRLGRQAEVQAAALLVQRSETAAARQLSAAALADMETVAFEKKQLLGQWRSSLVAMQKRDASLEASVCNGTWRMLCQPVRASSDCSAGCVCAIWL
jgi:chromosome segregation ATPase